MAAITLAEIHGLLEQFKGDGLMVSCYADLSVERGHQSRWLGPFKTKAGVLKKMLADDQRAWQACQQDLEAIQRVIEGTQAREAKGMAVFSAAARGFLRLVALDVPVENELVLHQAPYLVPLLEAFYRQREYLVVHSDTHQGRLYAASSGGARLLGEIEEDVPRKQHSVGERWGKEQATIARHREDCIHHYHKDMIHLVEKTWASHPFRGLILLGEHEVLEHIRKLLPARLEAEVICEAPHAWTDKPLASDDTIRDAVAQAIQTREGQLLEEVKGRLQQGFAVAAGPEAVVAAVEEGRVGPRGHGCVFLGPDPRESVACCRVCRYLSVEMPETCPRCHGPCVTANLWEELLLLALRHDIDVHFVKADAELARHRGVVAALGRRVRGEG